MDFRQELHAYLDVAFLGTWCGLSRKRVLNQETKLSASKPSNVQTASRTSTKQTTWSNTVFGCTLKVSESSEPHAKFYYSNLT